MNYMHVWGTGWGIGPEWAPFVLLIALWSLFWKGLALWHSSRRDEMWWFIAMLVLNTVGILEIIYLFAFAKLKFDDLFKKGPVTTKPAPAAPPAAPHANGNENKPQS